MILRYSVRRRCLRQSLKTFCRTYTTPPNVYGDIARSLDVLSAPFVETLHTGHLRKLIHESPCTDNDFGANANDYPLEALDLIYERYNNNSNIASFGKVMLAAMHVLNLHVRKRAMQYVADNPDVLQTSFGKNPPIIIASPARTGTTYLHRMLATDPNARAFKLWELNNPVPGGDQRRKSMAQLKVEVMKFLFPDAFVEVNKHHDISPNKMDEEIWFGMQNLCLPFNPDIFIAPSGNSDNFYDGYCKFVYETPPLSVYRYFDICLKLLCSYNQPSSHIILKTPLHALYLPEMLTTWPNANIIFMHRDPHDALKSFHSMMATNLGFFFGNNVRIMDNQIIGNFLARDVYKRSCDNILNFCDENNYTQKHNVCHIDMEELSKDPEGIIEQIYQQFGLEMTSEFRENIVNYDRNNPRHKHGKPKNFKNVNLMLNKHSYGVSREKSEVLFGEYYERFFRQSRTVHNGFHFLEAGANKQLNINI